MNAPLWLALTCLALMLATAAGLARRQLAQATWRGLARFCALRPVADYLIARASRTPYQAIDGYMDRSWLFNAYDATPNGPLWDWLPSIRIHHILREDLDRDPHDHPWDFRTIILRGWYWEHRLNTSKRPAFDVHFRPTGTTASLAFGEYHRISRVSPGGVWTLFITWGYRGTWGFYVDGEKVNHRDYPSKNGGS